MTIYRIATCVGLTALAGTLLVSSAQPVHALTMKECSAKYQAAKAAGTLGGQNWRDFRQAECGACLDQYNANKTSNGNGGLRWIQKGGGYYSECTKQLKG